MSVEYTFSNDYSYPTMPNRVSLTCYAKYWPLDEDFK